MVQWIVAQLARLRRECLQAVLPQLTEEQVEGAFRGFRSRLRLYPAYAVVRTFLAQIAAGDGCRSAVERGIQQGWIDVKASPNEGAYCQARKDLPERTLRELALGMGRQLDQAAPQAWRWLGRVVKLVDGSSTQLPDTKDNQRTYPQPPGQKPGCGFPVMYFTALISLSTGVIQAIVTGREGKERSMFRNLWRHLEPGDVVLGDAGFGSYCEITELLRREIDGVFRVQGNRKPFRGARPLGPGQWQVCWTRPEQLPGWVAPHRVPPTLSLRLIHFHTDRPGFRSKEILLLTTLLDTAAYSKRELIRLYTRRWEMELRLRDIKTTLGLDKLSCKSAQGCRKELWMGVLLYHLIRSIMIDAAVQGRLPLARISFAGTLQRLQLFAYGRLIHEDPEAAYRLLLDHLIRDPLPLRPNRLEPRKLKRRLKNYPLLTRSRSLEKQRLLRA